MKARIVGMRAIPDDLDGDLPGEIDMQTHSGDESEPALDRRAIADGQVTRLHPSQFALFLALRDAVPHAVAQKLAVGHKLCIIVRLPDGAWIEPLKRAVTVLHFEIAARLDQDVPADAQVIGTERSWTTKKPEFPLDRIVDALTGWSVAIPVLPGESVPEIVQALADIDVGLREIDPDHLLAAVQRRFQEADAWPADIAAWRVQPRHLDLAVKRATTAADAFGYLRRLAEVPTDDEARTEAEAKEKREAEAKKSSSSNRGITPTPILRPQNPKLEDLYGYGPVADWGRSLCQDLAAYNAGEIGWSDVDAGCLLYGPPGTGKTLFASALAASAGLPFIATSYADWQSQGEGHSGYIVKAIKERFKAANENAPCILFIDEIDTIPARGSTDRNDNWWTMIVTTLLECLDGTSRREGIVVIGACNHAEMLDPALVRSGRLDRRFEIGLPDEEALARIFAHHLPGADQAAFEVAATALAGTISGADVARIAREAR